MTADIVSNSAPTASASRRARLVLPVPGGPHSRSDAEVAAIDRAAERPALADEVRLADELVEAARAHPGGERLALGRWLEQRDLVGRWLAARHRASLGQATLEVGVQER